MQDKDKGVKGKELEHSVRARNEMTKRLNRRRTAESSLHSIALQMNGRALTRMHDAGMNPPESPSSSLLRHGMHGAVQSCFSPVPAHWDGAAAMEPAHADRNSYSAVRCAQEATESAHRLQGTAASISTSERAAQAQALRCLITPG